MVFKWTHNRFFVSFLLLPRNKKTQNATSKYINKLNKHKRNKQNGGKNISRKLAIANTNISVIKEVMSCQHLMITLNSKPHSFCLLAWFQNIYFTLLRL